MTEAKKTELTDIDHEDLRADVTEQLDTQGAADNVKTLTVSGKTPDLRTSSDERIRQQIAEAAARRQQAAADRAQRQAARAAGLLRRHAVREARARLTERHGLPPSNVSSQPTAVHHQEPA